MMNTDIFERFIPIDFDADIVESEPQRSIVFEDETPLDEISLGSSFNTTFSELSVGAFGSILVHLFILIGSLTAPQFFTSPVCTVPVMTVNLVSFGELGGGLSGIETPGRGTGNDAADDSEPPVYPLPEEPVASAADPEVPFTPAMEQAELPEPEKPPEPEILPEPIRPEPEKLSAPPDLACTDTERSSAKEG